MKQIAPIALAVVLVAAAFAWFAAPDRAPALAAGPSGPGGGIEASMAAPRSEEAERQAAIPTGLSDTSTAEPGPGELEQLQVDTPFGTLEVLVLSGRNPLAGARVLVHGGSGDDLPEDPHELGEGGLWGSTGGDGLVRFPNVAANQYTVRVHAPRGDGLIELTTLHAQGRTRRVVAMFGTGAIHGGVYDGSGLPVADCPVAFRFQQVGLEGQTTELTAATDSSGRYRIERLPSETAIYVSSQCDGEASGQAVISLEAGEHTRVDFGSFSGSVRWTGRLLDTDGAWIEAPVDFSTRREGTRELNRFKTGPDGTFDVVLLPGKHLVSTTAFGVGLTLAELTVGPGDTHGDLTLPGTRLEVELVDGAGRRSQALPLLAASPTEEGKTPDAYGAFGPSQFVYLNVPPGDYMLTTKPHATLGGSMTQVTIRADEAVQRIQVTVPGP